MISVILPILDEEEAIEPALLALASQGEPHEVVVADGGSRDLGPERARKLGARVIACERGRGRQMNAGAAAATGDLFLFLHVDTRLPEGALAAVRAAASQAGVVGGGFLKRYDGGGWLLATTASVLNLWRTRIARRLVGTQGIFARREAFERLGGYPDWPFLEDVGFSDRLRSAGEVAIVPLAVETSARRYLRRGIARQILVNAAVMTLFRIGVPPARLNRFYRGTGR